MSENDLWGSVGASVGADVGAAAASGAAAATDAICEGMDVFREAADRLFQCRLEIRQGNLFEYIEVAKLNAEARGTGSTLTARLTAANGQPHAPADIEILDGDRVVDAVQAKSGKNAVELTHRISNEKYQGMQKLVPREHEDHVRELAERRLDRGGGLKADEYSDTVENITGELRAGDVNSGGTSYREAVWAAKHPKVYATYTELRYVGREVAVTAGHSAAAAALVGGAVSAGRNLVAVRRGEITGEAAMRQVTKDAGTAAIRGGATGASSALIRYGAVKVGLEVLGRSNVATALAGAAIDVGVTLFRYAKGEITVEEAVEQVGQTGACSAASLYLGAAAGVAATAVGAPIAAVAVATVVGSVVGYTVVATTYQSCVALLRNARLADEESARLLAICEVACEQMAEERAAFERALHEHLQVRDEEFNRVFESLDLAMATGDAGGATHALAALTGALGRRLRFETPEDLDGFMASGETLVI